jgi:hypothetical protein
MAVPLLLPSKLPSYLRRMDLQYSGDEAEMLRRIVKSSSYLVRECTASAGWNDEETGHDVLLFAPADIIKELRLDRQEKICVLLKDGLNQASVSVPDEFFRAVHIELADDSDPEFTRSVPFSSRTEVDPEIATFWKPGYLRLFISHRDTHKVAAKRLGIALEGYGVSAFVAHDTIEPMTSWQGEIVKGLETMEVMLTFVTDDFHDSTWTNQEVGYALGKRVPIISFKVQARDPAGFIGSEQALRGRLETPEESAPAIYELLAAKIGLRDRLDQMLINAFVTSPDYTEARNRFDRMAATVKSLTAEQIRQIQVGYFENSQLFNAVYLDNRYNRLKGFVHSCTNKKVEITGRHLLVDHVDHTGDIPF